MPRAQIANKHKDFGWLKLDDKTGGKLMKLLMIMNMGQRCFDVWVVNDRVKPQLQSKRN